MPPVHTVPGAAWISGVRSCSGHSGNSPSSHSSKLDVLAFLRPSGKGRHAISSCRLPCSPGVAVLCFTVPWNQTHFLGCPFSEHAWTPCSSAQSGYSGCIAFRSSGVRCVQVSGFGLGSGAGSAVFSTGLGRWAPQASAPSPSGRGRGFGDTGSGAGLGAGSGALQPWMVLYVGPCPSLGRCMPRILLAWVCGLSVRS